MKGLETYLFSKLGVKFIWLDYLIRRFKIASHIEICDYENNIVNIDGKLMYFYPQNKFKSHYQMYTQTGKSIEELQKLMCPVKGINTKF